jgi:uncharacterized protein YbjQ (UPF0145 family)
VTAGGDREAVASASAGAPAAAPFGSALTVPDFALLEEGQLEPLVSVMGCDLRWRAVTLRLPAVRPLRRTGGASSSYLAERWHDDVIAMPELDAAMAASRARVFDRLRDEAMVAGADVVVGVREVPGPIPSHPIAAKIGKLARSATRTPILTHPIDLQLIGTAVRDPANPSETPVLSTLSIADFAKLRRGGWQPAGVVWGCGHYFGGNVHAGLVAREVEAGTEIWTAARSVAFEQLRAGMTALAADGMIGLAVARQHWEFSLPERRRGPATGVLVRVTAIATAIRRAAARPSKATAPMRILTLR